MRPVLQIFDAPPASRLLRVVLGFFVALAAVLLRVLLDPMLGEQVPFAFALAGVTVATWVAAREGGLVALLTSAILIDYLVVAPRYRLGVLENFGGTVVFLTVGVFLAWQVGRWRKADQGVRASEAKAREARDQLRRQFLELEAIYRSAPVGLCVLDRQMRWVQLNERLADMNGFPVEAHLGRTIRELLPDLADQAEPKLREIFETGRALPEFDISGTTAAEPVARRWWRERWAPIKDEHGTVMGVAVATEDITDQKNAECALREALETAQRREAEISSIYDSAPIGLCIFDRDGRFLRINQRLAEINGVPPEAHIGRHFRDVVPGIADQAETLLRQVIETGLPVKSVELRGELPGNPGVIRTWAENWFPVRDSSGSIVGVNVAVEEITDRKRVEEELRHANQAKDDFLATLSHELRTPLNAMLGWSQMLARGGLDRRLTRQAVETIFRNAQWQTQLVTDVLDVSRMMSGKLRLDLQEVDAIPLLRHAIESVQPAADARQLDLHMFTDMDQALLTADPARLQQVFWNLLSNAVKFTEPGGRVTVRVTRGDGTLDVIVTDTGVGISPSFLPHVFERFSQADASTTRLHSGLGLGLAIVRHLVELHGGTAHAMSDGEGRGATFSVSFPTGSRRMDAEEHEHDPLGRATLTSTAAAGVSLQGLHVLVVDDVSDARELVAVVLEREGARVTTASSGEEALQRVASVRPDLVIADIGMPGLDGYEFLRRLRQHPPESGGSIPAIALTAYGSAADRARALGAGFAAHLAKPVLREHLLEAIALSGPRTGESPEPAGG